MNSTFDLDRFVDAQDGAYGENQTIYQEALSEMRCGSKRGHWIWYIFPQIAGLGQSFTSRHYAISCLNEAKAYLNHPVLGPRLREITQAVLSHANTRTAEEIMGWQIDAMKLKSSMTLFDKVSPNDIFAEVLDTFFDCTRCRRTLSIV